MDLDAHAPGVQNVKTGEAQMKAQMRVRDPSRSCIYMYMYVFMHTIYNFVIHTIAHKRISILSYHSTQQRETGRRE